jgi:hypothetical protein
MKRSLLFLFTFALAVPVFAAPEHGREQSYFTFDDGGTVLKQGDDGRDVDVRVNLPVYPGDDITTSRRGRSEIHLSDGNVLALDSNTSIHVKSILDSYGGDNSQTVVELRYGRVAIQRTDGGQDLVRLDTPNASYVAHEQAIYAVEAASNGKDRVLVFDGSIEVRTPNRTVRIRSGEEARVDDQGLFGLVSRPRGSGDEFERWFTHRAERYGTSGRYLDRSLAYSESDLNDNGSWVYVNGMSNWCWRPRVEVGWRPYYHGYWHHGPSDCLTWVSYEPWGWAPYHYGRWAYDPLYGWVWLPGATYAPAWVYWMYGPSYIGWAPMGWYDCYRPYYDWAYRPYASARFEFGWGFYGRVRVSDIDLRPWTFITPDHIVSTRVDRAALTTDVIRDRLRRDPGAGVATIGSAPARFTRAELRDPAAAVNNIIRRGIGSGTGKEGSGSAADMTPFFRRDPEISTAVRDRVVRSRPSVSTPPPSSATNGSIGRGAPSGVPSPGTDGTLEGRVNRGDGSAPRGDNPLGNVPRGTLHRGDNPPAGGGSGSSRPSGIDRSTVDRGTRDLHRDQPSTQTPPPSTDRGSDRSVWRDRVVRERPSNPPSSTTVEPSTPPPSDNWRGHAVNRGGDRNGEGGSPTPRATTPDRGSDIPRRIIDRIGGARIYGDGGGSSRGNEGGGSSRGSSGSSSGSSGASAPPRSSSPPPQRDSPPPQHNSPPPSSPPPASQSSSEGHSEGGHVKRN